MAPMGTMIASGLIAGVAAVTTLVSGTIFKRAYDAHQQGTSTSTAAAAVLPPSVAAAAPSTQVEGAHLEVGSVKSVGQTGGVTAAYVESVKQGPPEK